MMCMWLDTAEIICRECVRKCNDYAGGGDCPYYKEFEELEKLYNMRDALEVLWSGLSFDDPLCEHLQPVDEKINADYDALYSWLMKAVESDFDDGMFAGISPCDDGDYPEQCCHWE